MARWRRIAVGTSGCGCLGVAVGGVGGLVLAGVVGGVVVTVGAQWESALRSALDSATGGEVTFDHLGLSWSGVVVRGVVVTAEDGQPVLRADKVKVGVRQLDTLRTDRWSLSSLDLQAVRVDLRRKGDGWAMPRKTLAWLSSETPSPVALPTVEVPAVRIRDCTLSVPLERQGPPLLVGVDELHLEGVELAPQPGSARLAFQQVKGRDATVKARGLEAGAGALAARAAGPWALDGAWGLTQLVATDARLEAGDVHATVGRVASASADLPALDLGAVELSALEARLGKDTVQLAKVVFDPDPGAAVLVVPAMQVTGLTGTLADWGGLGAAMESWGRVQGLGLQRVRVEKLAVDHARVGGTELGGTEVTALRVGPERVVFDGLSAEQATVGPVSVTSLRMEGLETRPSKDLRLPATRAAGASVDVDLYAPHLGLGGLVGALPAGTSFARLTLDDTKVAVKAGKRSADGTIGSWTGEEVASSATGWTVPSASFERVDLTLRSSSGALSTQVGSGRLREVALAERTTIAGGTLSGVSASEPVRGRVARAASIELGGDGVATVSGGEAWTALTGPHALAVPPVLSEHVPAGLGGTSKSAGSWWDIALSDLPWVPKRIGGAGTLHLADEAVAPKTWDLEAQRFSLGPFGGDSAPISAQGVMAGGTFEATGQATAGGKVHLELQARSLDAKEFEPYATPLLRASGLGVGPGRVAVDAVLKLDRQRLIFDGRISARNVTLVVDDKKKLGAALVATFKGGRYTIDDRTVPVLVNCALDAPLCSPVQEVVADVTNSLVDAASHGIGAPATGVADGVKGVFDDIGLGGKKGGKKK